MTHESDPISPAPPLPAPPSRRDRTVCILGQDNGAGLSRDREILATTFDEAGWEVLFFDPREKSMIPPPCVLAIHLESPATHVLGLAQRDILIPNPEWWGEHWTPLLSRPSLMVWAKTEDAARIFQGLGAKVERVGFQSRDHYDPRIPRKRAFLHIGGASPSKNTALLISCWREEWPHLTVVSLREDCWSSPNVTVLRHISEEELRYLQNAHLWHIYPSHYEGYGHAQWEGLSCGALVFVTGPLYECEAFLRLSAIEIRPKPEEQKLIVESTVTIETISEAVSRVQALSEEETRQAQERARSAWEKGAEFFRERVMAIISVPFNRPRVISVHSPFDRCGIREYGRQLDEALRNQGAEVLAFTHDQTDTILDALDTGGNLLVHYENALIRPRFYEILNKARSLGRKIVFCCHWFGRPVLSDYRPLVDHFVVHRPYEFLPNEQVVEIPLGCPVYAVSDRAALRRKYGLPEGKVIVTTIGFLVQWKRIPETVGTLLVRQVEDLFLQVLTPLSFQGDPTSEEGKVCQIITYNNAASRIFFSTEFRPESELLDRLCASDLGFLYHAHDTGSVSSATKQFVSTRTPLVVTGSTHARDLQRGIQRVEGFEMEGLVEAVVSLVRDHKKRESLRADMEAEYERLNMLAVAQRYLDLLGTPR